MSDETQAQLNRRKLDEEDRKRQESERWAAIAQAREEKKIPARFWSLLNVWRVPSLTHLPPPSVATARALVERFAQRICGWSFLFLAGPPGVGKTTAAASWLDAPIVQTHRRWVQPPGTIYRVDIGTWEDVPFETEATARRFAVASDLAAASVYDADFWEELYDTSRLVVDDLGVEQLDGKGYALGNIVNLLTYRHANDLPTLITTNLRRADFEKRYGGHDGGRLVDRLKESARYELINGPSLRRPLRLDGDSLQ